ncbi:hypothetical protein [Nocardia sp. NPDC057272]|uniref:hypothetical protein n=1 Tax=Nocardia sp. NPDC057272 TaxID=3346079 RepID=UPI003641CDE0
MCTHSSAGPFRSPAKHTERLTGTVAVFFHDDATIDHSATAESLGTRTAQPDKNLDRAATVPTILDKCEPRANGTGRL